MFIVLKNVECRVEEKTFRVRVSFVCAEGHKMLGIQENFPSFFVLKD